MKNKKRTNKIKHDLKKVIVALFVLLFCFINHLHSQEWISNYVTKYFSDRSVKDFGFTKNALWILAENLYRIENGEIVEYYFDSNSTGNISNYLKQKIDYPLNNILTSKDKVWIWYDREQCYLMIQNDNVYNLRFEKEKYDRIFIEDNILDEYGNMFIITRESYINKSNYKIFYYNGKSNFVNYHIPLNLDNDSNFSLSFFKQNNLKYFVKHKYKLVKFDLFIFNMNDSLIKKFESIKCGPPPNSFNYYINEKNIYLLFGGGKLFHLDTNLQLHKYSIPYYSRRGECYWFIVDNDDLYFSSWYGLKEYNLKTCDSLSIKEPQKDRYGIFNVSFQNIKIKDNHLYGNYNGKDRYICGLAGLPGIYIYKME